MPIKWVLKLSSQVFVKQIALVILIVGDEFVKALNKAIHLGMDYKIRIETPLMWLNKAETWALADYHKQLDLIRYHTLSCYNGIKGSGCGDCDACALRAKGLRSSWVTEWRI